jgi:hypothetical protein
MKKRIVSLTITSLLLISTLLIIAYTPNSAAATVKHTATVSPVTTTSPSQKYVFNVTNLSTANEKNHKCYDNLSIRLHSDWCATAEWMDEQYGMAHHSPSEMIPTQVLTPTVGSCSILL